MPTFSDALALVRRFFGKRPFSRSPKSADTIKVSRALLHRLRDIAIFYAARLNKVELSYSQSSRLNHRKLPEVQYYVTFNRDRAEARSSTVKSLG